MPSSESQAEPAPSPSDAYRSKASPPRLAAWLKTTCDIEKACTFHLRRSVGARRNEQVVAPSFTTFSNFGLWGAGAAGDSIIKSGATAARTSRHACIRGYPGGKRLIQVNLLTLVVYISLSLFGKRRPSTGKYLCDLCMRRLF